MPKTYPHIYSDIRNWPISRFYEERKSFIEELNGKVFSKLVQNYKGRLEELLSKTIYLEKQRVRNTPWKVDPSDDSTYWRMLESEINEAIKRTDREEALQHILKRIINRYNEEIVGGFKIGTFKFARRFLTSLFKKIFIGFKEKGKRVFWGRRKDLVDRIIVDGYVDETRALFEKGTVVVVPTHFSNLDSIMLGYAIDTVAGMPAFAYGAGLNLYDAEIPAYFMNRLGAYRVDRRKKNPIYLECLTDMAAYSMYKGLNNIFFPGGTRSRSGAMEEKLKLGLLGSVIDAQRSLIEDNNSNKIYVVPVILGYHFVFEAKSLIEQHLRAVGKEKYSKSKENTPGGFSFSFLKLFFKRKSEFYLSFGEPMDVLGNPIDAEGNSMDKHGRTIDLKDYFLLEGELNENNQRESIYAKLLGEKVLESYFRNNLVLPSHLAAFTAFKTFQTMRQEKDIFQLMRLSRYDFKIPMDLFETVLRDIIGDLVERENAGKIRLHPSIHGDVRALIEEAIAFLGAYHTQRTLYIKNQTLRTENLRLLYYYHNRLEGYEFNAFYETLAERVKSAEAAK